MIDDEKIIRTYFLTGRNLYRTAKALHLPVNEITELFRQKKFRKEIEDFRCRRERTP